MIGEVWEGVDMAQFSAFMVLLVGIPDQVGVLGNRQGEVDVRPQRCPAKSIQHFLATT